LLFVHTCWNWCQDQLGFLILPVSLFLTILHAWLVSTPWPINISTNEWVVLGCDLQVEIQVRKIYCINRAIPTLPINLEDAARSELEFEKAEQVCLMHVMRLTWILFRGGARFCVQFFHLWCLVSYWNLIHGSCDWRLERSLFVLDKTPAWTSELLIYEHPRIKQYSGSSVKSKTWVLILHILLSISYYFSLYCAASDSILYGLWFS
jgi:hypothetical protein